MGEDANDFGEAMALEDVEKFKGFLSRGWVCFVTLEIERR